MRYLILDKTAGVWSLKFGERVLNREKRNSPVTVGVRIHEMKDMEAIDYDRLFMNQVNNELREAIAAARCGNSIFTVVLKGNRKINMS